MNDGIVACRKCRTPHHLECWRYVGVCTTYGCQGREYDALRSARDEVLVIEDEKLPPQAQWIVRLLGGARETRSKDHFVWKWSESGFRCELHCLRLGSD